MHRTKALNQPELQQGGRLTVSCIRWGSFLNHFHQLVVDKDVVVFCVVQGGREGGEGSRQIQALSPTGTLNPCSLSASSVMFTLENIVGSPNRLHLASIFHIFQRIPLSDCCPDVKRSLQDKKLDLSSSLKFPTATCVL